MGREKDTQRRREKGAYRYTHTHTLNHLIVVPLCCVYPAVYQHPAFSGTRL